MDEVEARFWDAVEREDLEQLADDPRPWTDGAPLERGRPARPVRLAPQRRERSTLDSWRYRVAWTPLAGGRLPAVP